ncbi:MAG: hypothetical protein BWY86_01213 [Candidatus Aminicenantes bacterium ADurb.Bin508]|nr:MAG: hypothetical protein BWY86_01213 [Candidatus Aminicenantes bacterium ADurb.Bin508]
MVSQPPSWNLITETETKIKVVRMRPIPLIVSFLSQRGSRRRNFHQCRTIPSWEREKVMKTLML